MTPHSFESALYYKRRLNTYNLYDFGSTDGHWNESIASRGTLLLKQNQKVAKNLLSSSQIIVVPKIKTNFMLQCYGMLIKNSV